MKNQTIYKVNTEITDGGYEIYVHAGRLLAVGFSRWQGSISDDRWIYDGDVESCLAANDVDAIADDISDAANQRPSLWRQTSKGHKIR